MKSKRLLAVVFCLAMVLMLGGCKLGEILNNQAFITLVQQGGFNVGAVVAKTSTTADDILIADAYKLAREGNLAIGDLTKALQELKMKDPLVAGNIVMLLKNAGAVFSAGGTIEDISGISTEIWDAAAEGYVAGYELMMSTKKPKGAPAKVESAVRKYIPKK